MFLEPINAVTVCVGYADFLRQSAPWNVRHFNRWTVVTTKEDEATRHVCRQFGMHCLVTEDATRDGPFSKGRMVERGLQHGHTAGWMLHIDADIVLPSTFRRSLMQAHLEDEKIYGADRIMIRDWSHWQHLLKSGWLNGNQHGYPHGCNFPHGFEIGSRWYGSDGFVPIGFFQLWNRLGGNEEWCGHRARPYPISHGTACRTDVQFALQWDRRHRVLIPEVIVAHLESEKCGNGTNWKGRKTKPFGPPK